MDEVRLIVMPYELSRLRDGVGRGPEFLLEAGAEEALGAGGVSVTTEILEFSGRMSSEANTCFDLIGQVAARVRQADEEGAFPAVLSGSCFAAVGVMAGLMEPSPAIVWLDAHADYNTPETTVGGYFDGMGVAIVTGEAWQAMRAAVPGAGPISPASVVLAGCRDFDEGEEGRLAGSELTVVPPRRLESADALVAAVEGLPGSPAELYLHVDLDVLDTGEAKVNIYSAAGGPSAAEVEVAVGELLQRYRVRALSLTAYDPECDPEGRVPPIALALLRLVSERRRELEPAPG